MDNFHNFDVYFIHISLYLEPQIRIRNQKLYKTAVLFILKYFRCDHKFQTSHQVITSKNHSNTIQFIRYTSFLTHSTFTRLVPIQRYSEVIQNLAFNDPFRFKSRHTIICHWITMTFSEQVNKCLPNIFQLT